MKKAVNRLSNLSLAVAALALLLLCATGCATRRVVRVVDENGLPVPNALVVWLEFNLSPLATQDAGFADSEGEYAFKAINMVRLEAFGASSEWEELNLGNAPSGTVVLAPAPYDGFAANRYLSRTSHVPEPIRLRLEPFLRQKQGNGRL